MKKYTSNKLCSFWNSESQVDIHLLFIKWVVNSGGEKLRVKTGGDCLSISHPSEEKAASLTAVWGNEPILLRFAKLVKDLLLTLTTAAVAAVTLIEQHRRASWAAGLTHQHLRLSVLHPGRDVNRTCVLIHWRATGSVYIWGFLAAPLQRDPQPGRRWRGSGFIH